MPSPREYTIYVVVDDDAVRDSICVLMESLGFGTCAFGSANALLRGDRMAVKSCLIVDDALPGVSGFELLDRLRSEGLQAPAIVITQRVSAGAKAASDRVGAKTVYGRQADRLPRKGLRPRSRHAELTAEISLCID